MFSAFSFINLPSKDTLSAVGFKSIKIVDRGWTFPNGQAHLMDEVSFKNVISAVALVNKGEPICFDIETWSMATDAEAIETVNNFLTVLRWAREVAPELKYGFYGIAPSRNYWAAQQATTSTQYTSWQRTNDFYKPLAQSVDYLFPSLYTFYEDINKPANIDSWIKYAVANINEARRISDKPIYPFLWMQYHDSNHEYHHQLISGTFWKKQLETLYANADGVVIWGTVDGESTTYKALTWDENAEWWIETKQFAAELPN